MDRGKGGKEGEEERRELGREVKGKMGTDYNGVSQREGQSGPLNTQVRQWNAFCCFTSQE